jgi:hypothetical protein
LDNKCENKNYNPVGRSTRSICGDRRHEESKKLSFPTQSHPFGIPIPIPVQHNRFRTCKHGFGYNVLLVSHSHSRPYSITMGLLVSHSPNSFPTSQTPPAVWAPSFRSLAASELCCHRSRGRRWRSDDVRRRSSRRPWREVMRAAHRACACEGGRRSGAAPEDGIVRIGLPLPGVTSPGQGPPHLVSLLSKAVRWAPLGVVGRRNLGRASSVATRQFHESTDLVGALLS